MTALDKTTDIIIISTLCSQRVFVDLFQNHGVKGNNATQKFFRLLTAALSAIPGSAITAYSLRPISEKRQRKGWWRYEFDEEDGVAYHALPLLNVPILRNALAFLAAFLVILLRRRSRNARSVVVCDYLCFSVNLGAVIAARLRGFVTVAIATDYPGSDVFAHSIITRIRSLLTKQLQYSAYVCVTAALNEKINKTGAPSLITVGFVDAAECASDVQQNTLGSFRTVVYAGGLYAMYGLRNLIDAMAIVRAPNVRLLLYGTGPMEEEIVSRSEATNRIEYRGVVQNAELLHVLQSATLLINPRPSNAEYTLYSFPSKNLEFMCTGTPLLTTRMPGLPPSHESCVIILEDETAAGIADAIENALASDPRVLADLGAKARRLMLDEYSVERQAGKLYTLIDRALNI
jgi:glycosyltransferase involved in cell wall biosynthesis